ncbi:uncharacterized protein BN461_01257 [Bacteroides sp. CAG:1076]|nr:uncharacterized protein BN461_01257 [Bacteroides sp. CAG:1076]
MFLVVAGSIFTLSHVNFIICSLFGILTGYVSFTLLRYNVIDKSLLSLEIITHCLRFVGCFSILKDRSSLLYTSRISNTTGIDRTAVHIHGYQSRSQLNVLIIDFTITIQMSKTSFGKNDGIGSLVNYRCIQRLFLRSSIKGQRICTNRIYGQRVHMQ